MTGIPDDDYVHVTREDPARKGMLYAGTEHGIYVSFDDGDHWQSLRLDLPDTQVSDLVLKDGDLVIATHGRSFWVLDQNSFAAATGAFGDSFGCCILFKPDEASPFGLRPAAIDYYLQKPAAYGDDRCCWTVRASWCAALRGQRRKRQEGQGEAEDDDDDFGPPKTPPPGRKAGTNRFNWDLRYPGATVFDGIVLWSAKRGPRDRIAAARKLSGTSDGQRRIRKRSHWLLKHGPPRTCDAWLSCRSSLIWRSQIRDEVSVCDAMVIAIRKAE